MSVHNFVSTLLHQPSPEDAEESKEAEILSQKQILCPKFFVEKAEEDSEAEGEDSVQVKKKDKVPELSDILPTIVNKTADEGIQAENGEFKKPQILVITPDCYFAIDLFKIATALDLKDKGYEVKAWKLFSKHMKPAEQTKALGKKLDKSVGRKLMNVYIGTPNRMKKLIEMEGVLITHSLKYVVIHCKKNKKNFTIFDIKDTKSDLESKLKQKEVDLIRREKLAQSKENGTPPLLESETPKINHEKVSKISHESVYHSVKQEIQELSSRIQTEGSNQCRLKKQISHKFDNCPGLEMDISKTPCTNLDQKYNRLKNVVKEENKEKQSYISIKSKYGYKSVERHRRQYDNIDCKKNYEYRKDSVTITNNPKTPKPL